MHLKSLFVSLVLTGIAICGVNDAQAKRPDAHLRAHKEQLANAKSGLDKSVISNFMEKDIISREDDRKELSKESAEMINDLLKEARTHLGKRYSHGSKGPNAFDCSGFTSYVYKQFGYSISPSSRAQYTQGTAVERKKLRAGDLVFFTSRSSGKNVGHVGIVVSADNNSGDFSFIHASIKGVKVSTCSGYYEGRYIGAKRIITE